MVQEVSKGVAGALRSALSAWRGDVLWVPTWVMRRIVRARRGVDGATLYTPLAPAMAATRAEVAAQASTTELGIDADTWERAGDPLLLLHHPAPDQLDHDGDSKARLWVWRALFHASVLQALGAKAWTPAQLQTRIHRLGQAEFEAARAVLEHEERLSDPEDSEAVYHAFVATYLELSRFEPVAVGRTFPFLVAERDRIEQLVSADVDPDVLLKATRVPDAPEPAVAWEPQQRTRDVLDDAAQDAAPADPAAVERWTLKADAARAKGNVVGGAILLARTALRAPDASKRADAAEGARAALTALAERLGPVLGDRGPTPERWLEALEPLLPRARRGIVARSARLLYDLQKACVAHEREIVRLNLWRKLRTFGESPWLEPLTMQRRVRALTHLRTAAGRVPDLSALSPRHQTALDATLKEAVRVAEANLRDTLEPKLAAMLEEIGLHPSSVPERAAARKLVAELTDQIMERGFLSIGPVRDALSRNALPLRDLSGLRETVIGDPLLRLDEALERDLPGVYRRGEVYMRTLQRLSALGFGTRVGRALMRWVVLPLGGAYVVLEGVQHTIVPLVVKLSGMATPKITTLERVGVLAVVLWVLIQSPKARALAWEGLKRIGAGLRAVFVDLPRWFAHLPWVQAIWHSAAARFVRQFIAKPLLLTAFLSWILPVVGVAATPSAIATAGIFTVINVLINSRLGLRLEDAVLDSAAAFWRALTGRLIPGLVRWVLDTFKRMTEAIERGLYTVDEWLRFREGNSTPTLVAKLIAGAVWAVVAYIARIYVNLLIEPQVNPIKHFPVVTVSHKIILPFTLQLTALFSAPLKPFLGVALGTSLAAATVVLLPGVFGFLVWEFKANWKLYDANRPDRLKPVMIGHHGESMRQLLQPGFHSGTLPKLYAKLRHAEDRSALTGDWSASLKHQEALHHVKEALGRFVERELIAPLKLGVEARFGRDSAPWEALSDLEIRAIGAGLNRIQVTVGKGGDVDARVRITIEEHERRLLARVEGSPWLAAQDAATRSALAAALAAMCARADVDLSAAQLRRVLPPGAIVTLCRRDMIVWEDDAWLHAVRYSLTPRGPGAELATSPHGKLPLPDTVRPLRRADIDYKATPLTRSDWARFWEPGAELDHVHPHAMLPEATSQA